MRRRYRRAGQLFAGALASLALVACGAGSSSGTSSTATSPPGAAASQGTPAERFHEGLVNHSGFSDSQATCIVKRVLSQIGRAEFDRLYGRGNTPGRVQQVILKASLKCAPRGAGQ
jgi:hypothetical protein